MARRRKRTRLTPIIIVLLLLALLCALLLRFVFVVRNVDVYGDLGTFSQKDVIRAGKVNFGTSIFRIDTEAIIRNINTTGTLRAEDAQLHYPDTIRISVQMRKRCAMLLHLGKIRVMDEYGCLVESLDDVPGEDLIYISGMQLQGCAVGQVVSASDAQLQAYCNIMQAMVDHAAGIYVSEIKLENTDDIRLITRTGIIVEMGDGQNAGNKIAWMKSAVADLESRGEKGGTLDVRSGTKADYRPAK